MIIMTFEIALIVFYAIPVWNRIKMSVPDAKDKVVLEIVALQLGNRIFFKSMGRYYGEFDRGCYFQKGCAWRYAGGN